MPYFFTKIFRVLIRHWRAIGLSTIKFLDDGIGFCKNANDAEAASLHIRNDLFQAGAFWSVKKSLWEPVQKLEWLGVVWDAKNFSISAAPHRVLKIKETSKRLLGSKMCPVKALASFTGQIISLQEIVGNCCMLTTRCSQVAIASAPSWDCDIEITPLIKEELSFWAENVDSLNEKCFFNEKPPQILNVIESDASDSGLGCLLNEGESKALRLFSERERVQHSTFRELKAVEYALESFLPKINHSKVKILIDNQAAARIIDVGSMKSEIHRIAMSIFFICIKNGITLEAQWIPRHLNEAADSASREAEMVDTDDWGINHQFFKIINNKWGPLSIDCFANHYNAKLPRFYSLFHSPGCEGVDCFASNWKGENCLLVPPVSVAGRALKHLRLCRSKGVLVVPFWSSAHFWPMLKEDFSVFICDYLQVKGKNVLTHGHNTNSLLGSERFLGDVLALYIDCS